MFDKKLNEVTKERDQLKVDNERLTGENTNLSTSVKEAEAKAANLETSLQAETQKVKDAEAAQKKAESELEAANTKVSDLEKENQELREVPGSASARIRTEKEAGSDGAKDKMDEALDFVTKNASDRQAIRNYIKANFNTNTKTK